MRIQIQGAIECESNADPKHWFKLGMHRELFLPDIRLIKKAGYRISGRIFGLTTIILVKYQINLQTNYCLLQTLNKTGSNNSAEQ
jgi:hypothetical protein